MNSSDRAPVFVYGSLLGNPQLRQLFLGERTPPFREGILPGYERIYLGNGLYTLQEREGADTHGRVLYVRPEGLRNLDENLEGHFKSINVDVFVDDESIEVPTYVLGCVSKPNKIRVSVHESAAL